MLKVKFFLNPINNLEKWLNSQSEKGLRLKKVSNCFYQFDKEEKKYFYAVQYVGCKAHQDVLSYIKFLESMDYKIFFAPLNQGNFAFGKIRWRPYTEDQIASTLNNTYNKELLIVESSSIFEEPLLTSAKDLEEYYRQIRNTYRYGVIVFLALILFEIRKYLITPKWYTPFILCISLAILLVFTKILWQATRKQKQYHQQSKLKE